MDKRLKIVIGVVAVAGLATGGYFLYRYVRRRKDREAVEGLLELFRKENKLNPSQIDRIRFIFDIENYELPGNLSKAFKDNLDLITKAGLYARNKNAADYFSTLNTIKNRLPSDARPDFEAATAILYAVKTRLNQISDDSNSLLNKIGRFVKPGVDFADRFGKYAQYVAPLAAVIGSGLPEYVQVSEAAKSNPSFIVMRDLYNNTAYTKDQLKLFDKFWEVYNGSPFFKSEVQNVKI